MRKFYAAVMVAALSAGVAHAGSVGFDFGTNFYKPSIAGARVTNGSNFLVSWVMENDLSMGVYSEASVFTVGATTGTLTVSALQVTKGVIKNVAVGLNLGTGRETVAAANSAALVDILGTVNILSGKGDKVEGVLKATAAARFCNTTTNADGVNLGLAVGVLF